MEREDGRRAYVYILNADSGIFYKNELSCYIALDRSSPPHKICVWKFTNKLVTAIKERFFNFLARLQLFFREIKEMPQTR